MNADSAFVIGQSHHDNAKPCQDYALAGVNPTLAWAVVCDGCSTGGHTDLGARMWAHATQACLQGHGLASTGDLATLRQAVRKAAEPLLAPFKFDDGYATVVLVASDGRRAQAIAFGDGLIAAKHRDGSLQFWDLQYEANAPMYLNYDREPHSRAQWDAQYGGSNLRVCMNHFDADGVIVNFKVEHLSARHEGFALSWDEKTLADIECLFVCTDGASSFEGRSAREVLQEVCAVKSPSGAFMQRRMAAMARSWKKNPAAAPKDDLAVAALWLDTTGVGA